MVQTRHMRIGQLADAVGTTPRAIRYYHRLKLLPEPRRTPSGYRQYSMPDLLRLMRIRWLAGSGVPLSAIAQILTKSQSSEDTDNDAVADIEALLSNLTQDLLRVEQRILSLKTMLAQAKMGEHISALPRPVADAFDSAIAQSSDPATSAGLKRERELLELLALRGAMDGASGASALFGTNAATQLTDEYLRLLATWVELGNTVLDDHSDEIGTLATDLAAMVRGGPLRESLRDLAQASESSSFDALGLAIPNAAQRAVIVQAGRLLTQPEPGAPSS